MKLIAGIPAHKHFFFFHKKPFCFAKAFTEKMLRRKPVLKEKNNSSFGKAFLLKKRFVVNAADQGLRIREVGIGIGGDGRISGGYD